MTAIRLQSFRCLLDTGFVELRPLTILVGRNSSGKSSFLRFLPLLRQSVEARTTGPIQWYGDYVDFGGFKETHSTFSEDDEMRLGFRTTVDLEGDWRSFVWHSPLESSRGRSGASGPITCNVTLAIVPDPEDATVTRFRSVEIEAAEHTVKIAFDHPDKLSAVSVNGSAPLEQVMDQLRVSRGSLLPRVHPIRPRGPRGTLGTFGFVLGTGGDHLAVAELTDVLRPLCHGNTSEEKIAGAAMAIPFGTAEEILDALRKHHGPGNRWRESVEQLDLVDSTFLKIRDLAVANRFGAILQSLDGRLEALSKGVRYSKPVRATAERYYRRQDLAVDEIDPEGRNLAVFLRSLPDARRRDFEAWTYEEMGWKIAPSLRGGHISLRIEEKGGGSYNLADVGFGFSQMLPVLAQLWAMRRFPGRRGYVPGLSTSDLTFAIEQPELHLHPALQARLADTMSRAVSSARRESIGLTLVVETHSEAIVNRIGRLIADGELDSDLAAVVLFESSKNGKGSSVRTSLFDSKGYLEDWPYGFLEPG